MKKAWKRFKKTIGLLVYCLLLTQCPLLRAVGCGVREVGTARSGVIVGEGSENGSLDAIVIDSVVGGVERETNPGAEETRRLIERDPLRTEPGNAYRPRRAREPGEPPDTIGPIESGRTAAHRLAGDEELFRDAYPMVQPNPYSVESDLRFMRDREPRQAVEGRVSRIPPISPDDPLPPLDPPSWVPARFRPHWDTYSRQMRSLNTRGQFLSDPDWAEVHQRYRNGTLRSYWQEWDERMTAEESQTSP